MKITINALSIIPGKVGGIEVFLVNLLENLFRIDIEGIFEDSKAEVEDRWFFIDRIHYLKRFTKK
jgi:hypothetical protein